MKELLKRIKLNHQRDNKEKPAPQPSSFVLTQDGEERRLYVGEKLTLDPGIVEARVDGKEDEQITSFAVSPKTDHIILYTQGGHKNNPTHRQAAQWGFVNTLGTTKSEELATTYTDNSFYHEGEKKYILGSQMYFDQESKRLYGPSWTLEYRP